MSIRLAVLLACLCLAAAGCGDEPAPVSEPAAPAATGPAAPPVAPVERQGQETVPAAAPVPAPAPAPVPRQALAYRDDLLRSARALWGLGAPVATFGAQIHQESSWREDARSPYAHGLAQFTPATAEWIGSVYPELAERAPYNPAWALRALVRYNRHIWERTTAATPCDRMAKVLAAYNGGPGWIGREERAAAAAGADPARWWGQVEHHCLRADWACRENRHYPRRILLELEVRYRPWGPGTDCGGVA